MNANPKPGAPAAPETPAPAPGTGVKVVKRQAVEAQALREKACSQCGRTFRLTPEQKFHLCPACYQKAQARRPAPRRGTSVLTQITCASCGSQEYLSLVPVDLSKALCTTCHAAARASREPSAPAPHPHTRKETA
jgi:DnaJ-class molecular chaperone